MSLLSRLFGKGGGQPKDPPKGDPVRHKGFDIYPLPVAEGGQHRICALIEKETGGGKRSHWMIRADLLNDRDAAVEASLLKGKSLIDQQGERIFDEG